LTDTEVAELRRQCADAKDWGESIAVTPEKLLKVLDERDTLKRDLAACWVKLKQAGIK
jgi:hypothetical protein